MIHEYLGGSHEELNPCQAGRRTLWKGGSSSSSNSSSTSTTNTDKRQVVDNQSIGVSSDSSTVNVYADQPEAVNKSIDLVAAVGEGALEGYRALLAATVALASSSEKTLQANTDLANTLASQPEKAATATNTMKYGLIAVAGLAAWSLFGKK